MPRRIHPKMSTWIQLFCPCKFIIYVHKKSATHLGHNEKVFWGSAVDLFAVYTSTFVLRQEKLSCLTPLSVLTDVVKVKSLANFKRLEKGLLSSTKKKSFSRLYFISISHPSKLICRIVLSFDILIQNGEKIKKEPKQLLFNVTFFTIWLKNRLHTMFERLNCVRILFCVSISADKTAF